MGENHHMLNKEDIKYRLYKFYSNDGVQPYKSRKYQITLVDICHMATAAKTIPLDSIQYRYHNTEDDNQFFFRKNPSGKSLGVKVFTDHKGSIYGYLIVTGPKNMKKDYEAFFHHTVIDNKIQEINSVQDLAEPICLINEWFHEQ